MFPKNKPHGKTPSTDSTSDFWHYSDRVAQFLWVPMLHCATFHQQSPTPRQLPSKEGSATSSSFSSAVSVWALTESHQRALESFLDYVGLVSLSLPQSYSCREYRVGCLGSDCLVMGPVSSMSRLNYQDRTYEPGVEDLDKYLFIMGFWLVSRSCCHMDALAFYQLLYYFVTKQNFFGISRKTRLGFWPDKKLAQNRDVNFVNNLFFALRTRLFAAEFLIWKVFRTVRWI